MADPTEQILRERLRALADPATGRDLIAAGLVESVQLRGSLVQVALRASRERAREMEAVARQAERLLAAVPGVSNATVVLTAHRETPAASPRRRIRIRAASGPRRRHAAAARGGRGAGRRLRQGRRRQVHHRGQPRRLAGAVGIVGRAARCRHLRPEPAAHARAQPPPRAGRRPDAADLGLGPEGDVDRLPGRRGDRDDLARPDGDGGAGADDGPGRLGAARHHGGGHAARHRRRAAHDGAAGAARRRGDRLHAAGHSTARCPPRRAHVRARQRPGARRGREHERVRLPELRPPHRAVRPRRRAARGGQARRAVPGRDPAAARHPHHLGRRHADQRRRAGERGGPRLCRDCGAGAGAARRSRRRPVRASSWGSIIRLASGQSLDALRR